MVKMALLEIKGLCKSFGGLQAVNNVTFEIFANEILGIIGPNGAGKTTVYNLITGYLKPTKGKIIFNQKDITGLKPSIIARTGIVRTFQAATIFQNFTVIANMLMAHHLHSENSFWKQFLNTPSALEKERQILEKSMENLNIVGLSREADKPASGLPYGQQKLLGLCMALAANPKIIMLDEPLTGMNKEEASYIMNLIEKFRSEGLTFVIVEHNIGSFLNYCDRLITLNYGEKIADGSPQEVIRNKEVIAAYLGDLYNAT